VKINEWRRKNQNNIGGEKANGASASGGINEIMASAA